MSPYFGLRHHLKMG